jgi:hypothetical protein
MKPDITIRLQQQQAREYIPQAPDDQSFRQPDPASCGPSIPVLSDGVVRRLFVPRISDLPYISSPPVIFSYSTSANVAAGAYTFPGVPSALVPVRPVLANAAYYITSINAAADCDEGDYMSNVVTPPTFQLYTSSALNTMIFREPIPIVLYLRNISYRMIWIVTREAEQIFGSITGVIAQGSAFIGKGNMVIGGSVTAQEIVDVNFIKALKDFSYPNPDLSI